MTDRRTIANADGTLVSDSNPFATKPQDFHFNVINGNFADKDFGANAGNNPGLSASVQESVNNIRLQTGTGSIYPYVNANTTVFVSSSNDNDKQTIVLAGLVDTHNPVAIIATLDGQTPVAFSSDIFRIVGGAIISSPVRVAEGNIYISTDNTDITNGVPNTLSNVLLRIDAGNGQASLPSRTVPINQKAFFYNFVFNSSKSTDAEIFLRFRFDKDDDFTVAPAFEVFQNTDTVNILAGTILPAKAELDAIAFSPTAGSRATVQFSTIFIDV